MDSASVNQFRALIETQLKEKETDIDTTITYINVGLLGLFLTINEKLIPFSTSIHKCLLYISVLSFMASFFIGIINKIVTTHFDRKAIHFIDNNDLKDRTNEVKLLEKSKYYDKILQRIRALLIIPLLFLGLIIQIIYFFINIKQPQMDKESIMIEIKTSKSDTTINLKNTNIHIFQTKDTVK